MTTKEPEKLPTPDNPQKVATTCTDSPRKTTTADVPQKKSAPDSPRLRRSPKSPRKEIYISNNTTAQPTIICLKDLSELKVLLNPPESAIRVVRATFILLGCDPNELAWRQCKRLLSQKGGAYFMNTIMDFEPSMASDKAITMATSELRELSMEHVLSTSLAAAGLFLWCLRVILE